MVNWAPKNISFNLRYAFDLDIQHSQPGGKLTYRLLIRRTAMRLCNNCCDPAVLYWPTEQVRTAKNFEICAGQVATRHLYGELNENDGCNTAQDMFWDVLTNR